MRATVVAVVARNADQSTCDRLHALAKAETSVQVKALLYQSLGLAIDPALAQRPWQSRCPPSPARRRGRE